MLPVTVRPPRRGIEATGRIRSRPGRKQDRNRGFAYNRDGLTGFSRGPYRHDANFIQLGDEEHFDHWNFCWHLGTASASAQTPTPTAEFGPNNPFYAASTLPFQAPPFDKIKDSDYQPAIDAGMAKQINEVDAIANNPAPPTFENTFVALERSGQLLTRVMAGIQLRDRREYQR